MNIEHNTIDQETNVEQVLFCPIRYDVFERIVKSHAVLGIPEPLYCPLPGNGPLQMELPMAVNQ